MRARFHWSGIGVALVPAALALAAVTLAGPVAQHTPTAHAEGPTVLMVEPGTNFRSWKFEPATIQVAANEAIVFKNAGGAAHTVTAQSGGFDSGNINAGGEFTWTPKTASTFAYYCVYHPWMTGTIEVTAPAKTATDAAPEKAAPAFSAGRLLFVLGVIGAAAAPVFAGGLLLVGLTVQAIKRRPTSSHPGV
ncbi:MAG: hypothetical protein HY332_07450 [Chloroflexi bacterium]|nr:hypothetical protein [Chloroflexota bacterium]